MTHPDIHPPPFDPITEEEEIAQCHAEIQRLRRQLCDLRAIVEIIAPECCSADTVPIGWHYFPGKLGGTGALFRCNKCGREHFVKKGGESVAEIARSLGLAREASHG